MAASSTPSTFEWKETYKMLAGEKLSEKCFNDMGIHFADPIHGGFEDLASKLNMTQAEIARIASCPNRGRELLKSWAMKPDTTVYVLYRILLGLNRSDVIRVLQAEFTAPFDLIISLEDENADERITLFHPKANSWETMREVIDKIPEFAKIPEQAISCTMTSAPESFWDAQASELQSKNISLRVVTHRGRSNTAPTTGAPIVRPKRDATTMPPTMPPIQETGTSSGGNHYETLLMEKTAAMTRARRGNDKSTGRIDFANMSSLTGTKRESGDSGCGNRRSKDSDRQSTESNVSDQDINWIDPANHLDPNTFGDTSRWTWIASDGESNAGELDLQSLVSDGSYMTVPGDSATVELDKLPGYHPDCVSTRQISNKLSAEIECDCTYIIRHSRERPELHCISIVFKREIVNYRIHEDLMFINGVNQTQYYFYENGPVFQSIPALVQYYEVNKMVKPGEDEDGPTLRYTA